MVAGFVDKDIGAGTVELNDLFFALHAFMISSIQLMQIFVYDNVLPADKAAIADGSVQPATKKLVMWPVFLIIGEWIFVMTIFFVELSGVKVNENISFLRAAGYCKALITLVKYMPQVSILLINYVIRCTLTTRERAQTAGRLLTSCLTSLAVPSHCCKTSSKQWAITSRPSLAAASTS